MKHILKSIKKTHVLPLLFSFCISAPVILPFLMPGYFSTHDGEWAVVRLGDMFRTIRDLQIPARYSGALNFGYGYPLFNFAYPFPYYLGTLIHLLGIGFVDTIKILFAASVPLSAFCMFLASSRLWKNTWAGLVSAVLYVYLPYRMVDLFVRGSLGESLSFILFPLLLYFVIKLVEAPASRIVIAGIAICLAILITTHNIMTVLFLPVFFIFSLGFIFITKKRQVLKLLVISFLLGIGLSAFFWIPALFEKQNILLATISIAERSLYFVNFKQLLFSGWGYGVPTQKDAFTYQLGWSHITVFFTVLVISAYTFFKKVKANFLVILAFLLSALWIVLFFMLFTPSAFIWKQVPLLREINYPWTLLSQLGFLASLLAGFLFTQQKIYKIVVVLCAVAAIIFVLPFARPKEYIDRGDMFYLTNEATTTSSNELMPLWVKNHPQQRFEKKVELLSGAGEIKNLSYASNTIVFDVASSTNTNIRVNTIYYPGWRGFVDGKEYTISYGNPKGVMDILVSKGTHAISFSFSETPLRNAANTMSVFSGGFVLLLLVVGLFKKKRL